MTGATKSHAAAGFTRRPSRRHKGGGVAAFGSPPTSLNFGRGFGLARFSPLSGETWNCAAYLSPALHYPARGMASSTTSYPSAEPAHTAGPRQRGSVAKRIIRGEVLPRPRKGPRRAAFGLFAALALATPAAADTCHFGNPGTTVSITPHADAWAEVTLVNRLAFRARQEPCVLHHDGQAVTVTYDPGPGDAPDVFEVFAPDGYFAAPDWLLVDDHTTATVLIWRDGEWGGM